MNPSSNSDLHVIFGAGAVGQAIMAALLRRGQRVRVVNRSGLHHVPAGVEVCTGDASDPAFSRSVSEGASVVYLALNPPYTRWPELFPRLQAGVLAGAEAAGARLVAMENVYMYGETGGQPLSEDLPYNAHTRKGTVRAQMSRDLVNAHEAGRVRVTMGRASDFFGPRALQSAMGERVFYPALAGRAIRVIGDPSLAHTYTYVPDVGRALVLLGEQVEALGQAWHIPAAQTLTTRQFVALIGQETGHDLKVQAAPRLLLRMLSLFTPDLRELLEMLYEFEQPFILDHSKFERAFGDVLQPTPLPQAIQETVAWFKANPAV